ncbi:MAG TPA: hypothetical protein VE869_15000, partial [Gemmatimonas sp.]|nr:hypothetical protein [Gemmatimonas sp.]
MTDTVFIAVVSGAGTVVVAVSALLGQIYVSRFAQANESERAKFKIRGEEASRAREKRRDSLVDAIAELLAVADPQISARMDYGKAVTLI